MQQKGLLVLIILSCATGTVGDICMGIYHNITGNATEDYDDGKGNRRFAGFCTVYFTITEVTGERNETFKYQLRPTSSS